MSTIDWVEYTERVVGRNHPSLTDVTNRPLRTVLTLSGQNPDTDFPGFVVTNSAAQLSSLAIGGLTVTPGAMALAPPMAPSANFARYPAGNVVGDSDANLQYSVNNIRFAPLVVPPGFIRINRVIFSVQALATSGGKARAGIYADKIDANGLHTPGALLADGGEFATDASTGAKTAVVSVLVTPGQLLWLAYFPGVAPCTVHGWSTARIIPAQGYNGNPGPPSTMFAFPSGSQAYGALPDPAPAVTFTSSPAGTPGLWVSYSVT